MTTKRLSAEERRKQILKSAIRVFAQMTYHGATTKRIAEEAGITEALIYRYFGSKRALFTEAIIHTSERLVSGLEGELQRNRDNPFLALENCFRYYTLVLERNQEMAKMIFLVMSELDEPDIRETYLPYQERVLKLITDTIDYWNDNGFLIANDGFSSQTASWLYYGTFLILALVKQSHGNVAIDASYAIHMAKPFFTRKAFDLALDAS